MSKIEWKPGNMLYPLPVVMVTAADEEGHDNIITVAWAGTVCTNPPMVSISVRPERYTYRMLHETGEFVINLTTEKLAFATDYCGVKSGRDVSGNRSDQGAGVPCGGPYDQGVSGIHRMQGPGGKGLRKPQGIYRRCSGGSCG